MDADGAGKYPEALPHFNGKPQRRRRCQRVDERFLREKLYRIQGIRHTRSTFSRRTPKLVISGDPLLVNAGV
jgi:hypothetical protein